MGSTKSLRYEVLVYPKTTTSFKEQQHQHSTSPLADDNSSSINPSATTALFETKLQRFTCDRENMQQYWIPEGFHPVLIPRAYLTESFTSNDPGHLMNTAFLNAGNEVRQLRSRTNNNDYINEIELRRRRRYNNNMNNHNPTNNDGTISKKKRNLLSVNGRTILGNSSPTVNMNNINRQRIKEISAIRNSAVTITSSSNLKCNNNNNNNNNNDRSPAAIIGDMWKNESENTKKHYERLAIRKKIAQALAFEQKLNSSSKSGKSFNHVRPLSRHHHVNPAPTCPNTGSSYRFAVQSNAVEGVDAINCNRSSFNYVPHQNVLINSTTSSPSSPLSRPIPDWMTRSDDEDYDENSDVEDNDSTVAAIAC